MSTLIALMLAEWVARRTGLGQSYTMSGLRVQLDRRVLFRVAPRSRADINSLGFRDTEHAERRSGGRRVIVAGDSFVMGLNVRPEQALPRTLQRALGRDAEVLSFCVYGYGPDQALLRVLDEGLDFDPDVVLLAVFPANDFNDLVQNELFAVAPDGEVRRTAENPVAAALPSLRLALLARRLTTGRYLDPTTARSLFVRLFGDEFDLLADRDAPGTRLRLTLMRGVLRSFRAELAARHVEFAVAVLPSAQGVYDPRWFESLGASAEARFRNERYVEALCDELHIRVVNLSEPFLQHQAEQLFDLQDGHFSVRGNELAASEIARMLASSGGVDRSPDAPR